MRQPIENKDLEEYRLSQEGDLAAAMAALRHFVEQLATGLVCAASIAKYAAAAQTAQYNLRMINIAAALHQEEWELTGEPRAPGTRIRWVRSASRKVM